MRDEGRGGRRSVRVRSDEEGRWGFREERHERGASPDDSPDYRDGDGYWKRRGRESGDICGRRIGGRHEKGEEHVGQEREQRFDGTCGDGSVQGSGHTEVQRGKEHRKRSRQDDADAEQKGIDDSDLLTFLKTRAKRGRGAIGSRADAWGSEPPSVLAGVQGGAEEGSGAVGMLLARVREEWEDSVVAGKDLRCFFQILGAPLNTFPPLPSPSLVPLSPLLFLSSPPPTLSSPLPPPVVAVQELYTNVTWPLYRKYGHAFEAFKLVVTDPDAVLGGLTKEITETGEDGKEVKREVPAMPEDVKANLIANIRRRMTPQPLKIRADIELKCFHYDGVLHIKDAMRRAEQESEEDCAVRIVLVAPPLYVLTTFTLAKDKGIAVLERAIRAASEEIDKHKGKLTVKEAPRAVSDRDDRLLAEHMQKLTDANAEVDGDVDSEDEDEGMGSVDIDNAGLTE
ncbi:unnamed protein product [Closterium sp. Naga37s-1]|nr:unnamed protein product [Closterium sp. Naga37s-1]CAI5530200.1 unnamed protein product [Closterium sp. Naga37s-1]